MLGPMMKSFVLLMPVQVGLGGKLSCGDEEV